MATGRRGEICGYSGWRRVPSARANRTRKPGPRCKQQDFVDRNNGLHGEKRNQVSYLWRERTHVASMFGAVM